MGHHRSIRDRRNRKRINAAFDLQLTSMLDIMMIVLVFLLKSASSTTTEISTAQGISLPKSNSPFIPTDSHNLIITPEAITFEDQRVLDFVPSFDAAGATDGSGYQLRLSDLDEDQRRIVPLFDALVKAREEAELRRARSKARDDDGKPLPFAGILTIQADRNIRYDLLRKVMYTAATARYKVFRFLAMRDDS